MTKDNGKYDKTAALRMRRYRERLNKMAKDIGFESCEILNREMLEYYEAGKLIEWLELSSRMVIISRAIYGGKDDDAEN